MDQEGGGAVAHRPAPDRPYQLTDRRLVAVGEVLRPHGLAGEIRVRNLSDDPERLSALRTCIVWDPVADTREAARIAGVRRQGQAWLVKLTSVDEPEAARLLTGRLLAVPVADARPLREGHYYPWQLEGCRVETEDGVAAGILIGIQAGPQELWVTEEDGREHLIPAVPEIVRSVDLATRRIVIRPPEGLLEL